MLKLPYGIADFHHLITAGYAYVDRTAAIRQVEDLGEALLFIRPRRFGKSLWLDTLRCYYDLRLAGELRSLFGRLAIGRDPTPLANRYFVLVWDFSAVDPRGSADEIGARLHGYVNNTLRTFLSDYRDHLPADVEIEDHPVHSLGNVLAAIRRTPYKLYLLVDEYDNFANEVMTADQGSYGRLVHSDGPFKQLFKWVKMARRGQGLERLFITGVSPVVMSDLSSGLNICENAYLIEELNTLCGFTEGELRELLAHVAAEAETGVDVEEACAMMRTWYNGYRFAPNAEEAVYNPTLVLYFLKHLARTGNYPRQMLDANLAADEDKLRYLGEIARGRKLVFDLLASDQAVEVSTLEERFTLADLLERELQGETFLASFLYYFGMLTLAGETPQRKLRLVPPNLVVKTLYVDSVRRYLGLHAEEARAPSAALTADGDIQPLLEYVEQAIFPNLSNRDYIRANETTIKAVFLALLADEVSYTIQSEQELSKGYADLCLLLRPDAREANLLDLLIELKYLGLKKLGVSGAKLRRLDREQLLELPEVSRHLAAAAEQLRRYAAVLTGRQGDLRLRCFAVVALGLERLVGLEVAVDGRTA
jgi:hypothetical protein